MVRFPDQQDHSEADHGQSASLAALGQALALCNNAIVVFAALALIAACVILSYSVLGRALFQQPELLAGRGGGVCFCSSAPPS